MVKFNPELVTGVNKSATNLLALVIINKMLQAVIGFQSNQYGISIIEKKPGD